MPRPDFKVGENNPNVLLVGACPGEDEEKKAGPFLAQLERTSQSCCKNYMPFTRIFFPRIA